MKKLLYLLGFLASTSFAASGSGVSPSPGGPDNAVQFGKEHIFKGTTTFTMNPTSNLLTVGATALFSNTSSTQWTNVSTITFSTGTILQLQFATPGACLETDSDNNVVSSTNGACGSGGGGGGGGGSGDAILGGTQTWSGTNTYLYGVTAASFTANGSGVGSLTLKDAGGNNFISLEASSTINANQSYVLPDSTGTPGQVLSINAIGNDGKVSTKWTSAAASNAAILTATQTFSGINTFSQETDFVGVGSSIFNGVSSMTFTNVYVEVLAGSTLAVTSAINANGSYGTAGQVLNSNGPGQPVSWGAGGGGGGGSGASIYNATATAGFPYGASFSTIDVTGLSQFQSSVTFSGSGGTVGFNNQLVTFSGGSSMTVTDMAFVMASGSTIAVNGPMQANGSYGTSGQVLQSNGAGNAPSWTSGSTGSGGVNSGTIGQMAYYAVSGTTVSGTSNLVNNTSSITVNTTLIVNSGIGNANVLNNGVQVASITALNSNGVLVQAATCTIPSPAGFKGEVVSSKTASATPFPTSTQYGDLLSISLSSGAWLVTFVACDVLNSATLNDGAQIGISTTSGNSSGALIDGDNRVQFGAFSGTNNNCGSVPNYLMTFNSVTTVYGKYEETYTGGPPQMSGKLFAIRAY